MPRFSSIAEGTGSRGRTHGGGRRNTLDRLRHAEPALHLGAWVLLLAGAVWLVASAAEGSAAGLAPDQIAIGTTALLIVGAAATLLFAVLLARLVRARRGAESAADQAWRSRRAYFDAQRRCEAQAGELAEHDADIEAIRRSISHDLRSPLSTISASTALVRLRQTDPDTCSAIDRVDRANTEILSVIERVNAYARAACARIDRSEVDVDKAVRDIVGRFRTRQPPGSPPCEIRIGPLGHIAAEASLVELLWTQVIDNALKYAGNGTDPRIEIDLQEDSDPVVYRIVDNGAGFDPANAEKVLEPFVRLPSAKPGQGLGLAIAARVAQRHGGRIWLTTRPGAGTSVFFHFGRDSHAERNSHVRHDSVADYLPGDLPGDSRTRRVRSGEPV